MLAFLSQPRLAAATPAVVRGQLGFLDDAPLGNIRRETWRLRHGGTPVSAVFCVAIDDSSEHWPTIDALQQTIAAAMHGWLMERDAAAGFARRSVRRGAVGVAGTLGPSRRSQTMAASKLSQARSILTSSA